MKVPLDTHILLTNTVAIHHVHTRHYSKELIKYVAVQYSQLLHYTALHTHNTAIISTPLIHGIDGRMALMAEMVMVELQAQVGQSDRPGKDRSLVVQLHK